MKKFQSPVYNVIAVPIEKIVPNTYNPNAVAPPEMKLLYESIKIDGYTMPIVCYYAKSQDIYVIVDGFHRYRVMLEHPDIYEREGGVLRLCVRDNGAGMEEAQRQALLRRLKSGEPRPDGRNIGLYNVDQRIRLQYGADYGVSIHSWPGKGTQVDLRLPARTGRES